MKPPLHVNQWEGILKGESTQFSPRMISREASELEPNLLGYFQSFLAIASISGVGGGELFMTTKLIVQKYKPTKREGRSKTEHLKQRLRLFPSK